MVPKKQKQEDKLIEIMGGDCIDKSSLSKALLSFLTAVPDEEERLKLVQFMLENFKLVPKSGMKIHHEPLDDEIWDRLNIELTDYIQGKIKHLVLRRYDPHDFARELWQFLISFSELDEQVFALATILFDPRIPYMKLPGPEIIISTPQKEKLLKSLKEDIRMIEMIISAGYSDNIARASLLNLVLENQENREEKAILMHVIITYLVNKLREK